MVAVSWAFEVAAPDEVVEPGDLIHRLLEPNGEAGEGTAEGVAPDVAFWTGYSWKLSTRLRCDVRIL